MKARRSFLLSCGLLLFISSSAAEGQKWWTFEDKDYYKPLIAGVREPHVSALALAWADRMPFMVDDQSPRQVWDIDLGAEIPLFGRKLENDQEGFGFWIPIDFHMIEDFVDDSEPIVNTDYRFGLMAKVRRTLDDEKAWAVRVFVGHESTHLGDEFAIVGQRAFRREFE